MQTSPDFRDFLTALLHELEASGCSPIILRNYEGLPKEIGNDLDIFVHPSQRATAESLLISLAHDAGAEILHCHARSYFSAIWLKFKDSDEWYHLDIYPGAGSWHGIRFLDAEELIAGQRERECYAIPRPAHEAIISSLSSWLWGGFFKQRYIPGIRALLGDEQEKHEFLRLLEQCFGPALGRVVGECMIDGDPVSQAREFTKTMRRQLCLRAFRRGPITSVCAWANYWIGEIKCVLRPPGCAIVLDRHILEEGTVVESIRSRIGACFGSIHLIKAESMPRNLLISRKFIAKNYLVISPSPIPFTDCLDLRGASTEGIEQIAADVMKRLKKRLTPL